MFPIIIKNSSSLSRQCSLARSAARLFAANDPDNLPVGGPLTGLLCGRSSFLVILAWLFLLPVADFAHAQKIVFPREFAPADSFVASVEKPYRDALCLNGTWQFQPQELPADYDKKSGNPPELQLPSPDRWKTVPIKIPSPWNANGFESSDGKGPDFRCFPSYPVSWEKVDMGWLRRTFRTPDSWTGRRVILRFNAVAGKARIFVNGKLAGEHFDSFLPFEFDITDSLKSGAENELLVGIQKPSLFKTKGQYGGSPYLCGSFWGEYVAGIWQDVFLEALPAVRVADVYIKPLVDQDELQTDVTLINDTDAPAVVNVKTLVHPWINLSGSDVLDAPEPKWKLGNETSLSCPSIRATIPAHGSTTVSLVKKVKGSLSLWSPEQPNLHGLIVTAESSKGRVKDCKYTRFGWRQFSFQGKQALLNGKPIVFKGDACHFMGIPEMTRRHAWAWFKMVKEANANTVRIHAQPRPSFYLDMADEMGICILDETAFTASGAGFKLDSPDFWRSTDEHLQNLILRDRNHPSIMGWSICNELYAFVEGVFHSPPTLIEELKKHYSTWVGICRTNDPTRPWISADGDRDGLGHLPKRCLR